MKYMESLHPENPMVSVIIPCYNHQKFIGEAIMSVLEQDYRNIELIVIDDGSSDNSFKIVKKLGIDYGFYYERQKNIGLVKTVDKALLFCHGQYIRILASDDKYLPNSFNPMIEKMSIDRNVKAVFSNGYKIRNNLVDGRLYDNELVELLSGDSLEMQRYFLSNMSRIFCQSGMFRRDLIQSVGGFDHGARNDDWVFLIHAFNFIVSHPPYRHEYTDIDGLGYRYHENNMSGDTMDMIDMIHEVAEKFIPDRYKKALLANVYWNAGIDRLKMKAFGDALNLLIKSQRYELSISRPVATIEKALKKVTGYQKS